MRTAEDRRRTLGTVLMFVAFALIFVFMLWWMYSVGLLVIPEPVAKLLGLNISESSDDVPWDTGELYSMLKEASPEELTGAAFEVGFENLRAALINEPPVDGYVQTARISHFSKGAPTSRRVRLYADGERFRIEKYADDSLRYRDKLLIAGSDNIYRLDEQSRESRSIPRGEAFTAEIEAGFPSISELTETIAMFPTVNSGDSQSEQKSERFDNCAITLVIQNGSNVYYVSFTDRLTGTTEQYWIALDYKVIISHRTYSKGELIYSFETIGFSVDSEEYGDDRLYSVS